MEKLNAKSVIELLALQPLEPEGGYYAETYRHQATTPVKAASIGIVESRPLASAIYYLVTQEKFSTMHRVRHDEIFHHYLGGPVELLMISPLGAVKSVVLGKDLTRGERPQIRVPGEFWQGLRLYNKDEFALLGTTMSPGFDMKDFELAKREVLFRDFPKYQDQIAKFFPKA